MNCGRVWYYVQAEFTLPVFLRLEFAAWTRSLTDSGFTEVSRANITQRVAESLEHDAARRREFVETSIARWLRPACGEFVALPGSIIHRELKDGQLAYLRFELERIG